MVGNIFLTFLQVFLILRKRLVELLKNEDLLDKSEIPRILK